MNNFLIHLFVILIDKSTGSKSFSQVYRHQYHEPLG